MASIDIKIQSKKGGNATIKNDIGYISNFINGTPDNRIVLDAFEGYGETYKRRETELIEVYEAGKILFTGSFNELTTILKGK